MRIGRNAKTCVNHNHWSTDYKFDSTINFTTMNKFILVIAMVCCITQLCSRFNAIYGTKHHIDMLDSISTNFARENTIYRGVRLWSMFNNPNKNYLCIKVNDTLIIVTDSELLFDTPLYSTTKEWLAQDFSQASIVYCTDIPFRAYVVAEGDTLIYEINSITSPKYNLSRGIVRNNIVNPNKNLFVGDSLDGLLKKIGLWDKRVLDYADKSNVCIFINTEAIKYHSRLREESNIILKCEFNAVFEQIVNNKIYGVEYGLFGRY